MRSFCSARWKSRSRGDAFRPLELSSPVCHRCDFYAQRTRDAPPLAVLLRSGDVVLLGGASRFCYHGVPRVLATSSRADADHSDGDADSAVHRYLATHRINLNVRQVHDAAASDDGSVGGGGAGGGARGGCGDDVG
mmetsp:Transcript_36579/g.89347  ORF Transcript_36579/g.89347 Transcript_36579/m.89347 type:complete len:136 (-) Transcript_36579:196-603(-)